MFRKFLLSILWVISLSSAAAIQKPLPADQAFQFFGFMKDHQTLVLEWHIAPQYYLYQDRFSYQVNPQGPITLQPFTWPIAATKHNELLGKYHVYQNQVILEIPLSNPQQIAQFDVTVGYQGCAESGFCYPPESKHLHFDLHQPLGTKVNPEPVATKANIQQPIATHDKIAQLLFSKNIGLIIVSFLGFGVLLSFTPCVLPMIPILSGLIIGRQRAMTSRKAFLLSCTYVLSMAITYAILGVIAGSAGYSLQAILQKPWVIATFSGIFVLLALSLFDLYQLKLPSRWEQRLSNLSNHQTTGTYGGAIVMGVLATLIVSPCVTAPLVGVLTYIANTANSILGGLALFMLGLGMGIPLILIAISESRLLPKTGPWMNIIKAFFGVLLLATAIHMLSRILPSSLVLSLWAVLLIISAVYLGLFKPYQPGWQQFWQGLGLVAAIYGILLMIGAALGNSDPWQPLKPSKTSIYTENTALSQDSLGFKLIKNTQDFEAALLYGSKQRQITLLEFYADWCTSCKSMDRRIFQDTEVIHQLRSFNVLRADLTTHSPAMQQLQTRFAIVAPPALLFFDQYGQELTHARVVGEIHKQAFLAQLQQLIAST